MVCVCPEQLSLFPMTKEFFYLSTGHKKEFDPNKLKNRIKFHTNKEKFDAKLLYYRIFL